MKFGLRWVDVLGAALGAVIVGGLDRLWDHYTWSRTLTTMAMLFVFLCALFYWLNRRREVQRRDDTDQRDGR